MSSKYLLTTDFYKSAPSVVITAQGAIKNKIYKISDLNDFLLDSVYIGDNFKVDTEVVLSGWDMPVSFMGLSFLKRFNVIINSAESMYYFEPRENYSYENNLLMNNFGFKLDFNGSVLFASEYYPSHGNISEYLQKEVISINAITINDIKKNPIKIHEILDLLYASDEIEIEFFDGSIVKMQKDQIRFKSNE